MVMSGTQSCFCIPHPLSAPDTYSVQQCVGFLYTPTTADIFDILYKHMLQLTSVTATWILHFQLQSTSIQIQSTYHTWIGLNPVSIHLQSTFALCGSSLDTINLDSIHINPFWSSNADRPIVYRTGNTYTASSVYHSTIILQFMHASTCVACAYIGLLGAN